jgi:translation initiation factor 1
MGNDKAYREVYSTDKGAVCPECSKPASACSCAADKRRAVVGDGNVRVRRETKGRGGKTVTTISGLSMNLDQLQKLVSQLKRKHGVGGAVKDGIVELQGDHCESVIAELLKQGIRAKRAGG